ncbi:BlaI/MecI/CopY family transcriptional regulator [Kitasatospora atroaurantiaca]|uniref:Putative transcriptional regulator n=1 Tax=Kitasatospora atroaurantiaca TaxID=285545 RepID=A0A561EXK7_9ACTN|nr:BlaI/MecI/CopY family transcriptional regulator [Kitasatospora atroaurantiaca]TWE20345.1 putative transcriptional regulator [Kitasatospora atroaurantiaca]
MVRGLGELEAEIMDRLWSWGRPATVRDVVDDINRHRPVAYTTVMTVADILHGKGLLRRTKEGRAWLYEPVRSREEYTAAVMQDVLGLSKDRPAALSHFVNQMSADEVAALRAALRSIARSDDA